MPILASVALKPFPTTIEGNNLVYLVGFEQTISPTNNGVVQKFNGAGTSQSITTFSDRINDVAVHTDGSYCITLRGDVGDVFLSKYNTNGTLAWSASLANVEGVHCFFDNIGRVYVTYFNSSTQLYYLRRYANNGLIELSIDNVLGGALAVDRFYNILIGTINSVRKYNSLGQFQFSIITPDRVNEITADKDGNIYFVLGSLATNDTFKYDIDGNLIWSKNHGNVSVNGIAVDVDANVYTTGAAISNVTTRKYDNQGNLLWSVGAGWGTGTKIKISDDGFVYLSQNTTEPSIQLRKLNSITGDVVWSRKLNTTSTWFASSLDLQYKS